MRIFAAMTEHKKHMQRCLQLAQLGAGFVAPNPMVGAVLVYNEKIIGEGFHQLFGQAHAEVNCINSVGKEYQSFIGDSILYVSLEPCSHHGKTPPCVDLIIEKKIATVVIGCKDTNATVNGNGIKKLQANGVNVITGVMEKEAIELNKRFFIFNEQHRPYIILKWAQSNDNKMAPLYPLKGETSKNAKKQRLLISNGVTNRLVHKWRSEEAAILVGTNTALRDDPALTTRLWQGNHPLRLVIDKNLKLPPSLQLFDGTTKTIVFNEVKDEPGAMLNYYKVDDVKNIEAITDALYKMQVQSVIVEGGATLLHSFIKAGLWDEARVITNTTMKIGEGLTAPVLENAILNNEEQLMADHIAYFRK